MHCVKLFLSLKNALTSEVWILSSCSSWILCIGLIFKTHSITSEGALALTELTGKNEEGSLIWSQPSTGCQLWWGPAEGCAGRVVGHVWGQGDSGEVSSRRVMAGNTSRAPRAPLLFVVLTERLMDEVRQESLQTITFLDDIVICGEKGWQQRLKALAAANPTDLPVRMQMLYLGHAVTSVQ